MNKKKLFFTLFFLTSTFLLAEQKKSFIIPKASIKESTNTLKEQVATQVKETLKEITKLQKKTSDLLITLAETQEQLLKAGSIMIKEKDSFKKASKEELAETKKTINRLQLRFNEGKRMLDILVNDTKKAAPFSTHCFAQNAKKDDQKKS